MASSTSMNPNPYLRVNAWSRFFHSWISKLLNKSAKQKTLHLSDLYDLLPHLESKELTDRLEGHWLDELKQTERSPSLVRATLRTLGWSPFLYGLLLIPNEIAKFSQPILLTFLMGFFEVCPIIPAWMAWLLAVGTGISALFSSIFYHKYFYKMTITGLQMRVAYSGLIFRKILRLSTHSMNNSNSGKVTNIVSNDAGQIEFLFYFLHYIWVAPIELALVITFLWGYVKYITFIAIGYTLILLLIQTSFGRLFIYLRSRILQKTDERVKIMSEIIKSMRIVKMYCWESAFEQRIRRARKREIIECAFRLFLDCIQTLLSHTYIPLTFLMICCVHVRIHAFIYC